MEKVDKLSFEEAILSNKGDFQDLLENVVYCRHLCSDNLLTKENINEVYSYNLIGKTENKITIQLQSTNELLNNRFITIYLYFERYAIVSKNETQCVLDKTFQVIEISEISEISDFIFALKNIFEVGNYFNDFYFENLENIVFV